MNNGAHYQEMSDHANRTAYLVAGYLRQTLTEAEHDELDQWLASSEDNQRLFEDLTDPEFIEKGMQQMEETDKNEVLKRIKNKIQFEKPKQPVRRRRWFPYGIAASLILLAGVFIYFQVMKKNGQNGITIDETEIKPGGNYATLTIGNKKINLYEAKSGLIDSANGIEVLKTTDGQLSYESTKADDAYHILETPVGGQYSVLLPDGTRVWLNSSSSLKYPASFKDKERIVELTGEAYFEVAKATSPVRHPADTPSGGGQGRVPFIVKLRNNSYVEVLGTHFNINAYEDENFITTTLLEGSVSVKSATMGSLIGAGQETQIEKNGFITTKNNADTNSAVAWKDGKFMFKDAPIETIMRQVGRWYNAEIVYEGKVNYHFNATIFRKESLRKLLSVLEDTRNVHFTVEGRRIVVRP